MLLVEPIAIGRALRSPFCIEQHEPDAKIPVILVINKIDTVEKRGAVACDRGLFARAHGVCGHGAHFAPGTGEGMDELC